MTTVKRAWYNYRQKQIGSCNGKMLVFMWTNYYESINTYQNIDGWELVTSFSVGGFEWIGFSKKLPRKWLSFLREKQLS